MNLSVDQIGILVGDLDAAIDRYGETFGRSAWNIWTGHFDARADHGAILEAIEVPRQRIDPEVTIKVGER